MKNLQFDFTVNKESKNIRVTREFAAPVDLVWDAWTKPEILDEWWAPKPWKTKTQKMDFREGGFWLYTMNGPSGEEFWNKNEYQKIVHQKNFSGLDYFCDKNGKRNEEFPTSTWSNVFRESDDTTTVSVTLQYEKLEDLEKNIAMGFKEGFTMALENLDQYIEAQFKLRKQNKTSNKARVLSYLNFDGKTEEAFLFYKEVFKTEFIGKGIERFEDVPASIENWPPVAESVKKMILHVELPITGGHILMGTDAPKEMGFTLARGNNMHICIEPETRAEAKRIFDELSAGGNITMPLADMFFGSYFGEFTDKYGINWMINFQNK